MKIATVVLLAGIWAGGYELAVHLRHRAGVKVETPAWLAALVVLLVAALFVTRALPLAGAVGVVAVPVVAQHALMWRATGRAATGLDHPRPVWLAAGIETGAMLLVVGLAFLVRPLLR